jgi:cytoskeletal protein CcmA (bactofilin family)
MSKPFHFGSAKNEEAEKKPTIRTVLGAGCSVEGKLVCTGPTRLDGSVTGELVADEFLLIDKNSTVIADLNVQELVVRGRVRGNIRAKRKVTLEDSAVVEGDISTPSIMINDGAQVVGKVEVTRRETDMLSSSNVETDQIVKKFAPARPSIMSEIVAASQLQPKVE